MSPITSATTPQFVQVAQTAAKTDATKTNAASAQQSPAASTATTTQATTESNATKNNDGTYGPKHKLLPPGVTKSPEPALGSKVDTDNDNDSGSSVDIKA